MSDAMDAKREQIVSAALGVFGRYGYSRSSMDLLAQAARMSRPALYQHFKGKPEVFRAVGQRFTEGVVVQARAAGMTGHTVADRLYGTLAVKLDLVTGSIEAEFRAEMFTEAGLIAEDIVRSFEEGYCDVVEAVLTDCADRLDLLGQALSAREAAKLLLDAVAGMTRSQDESEILRMRLRQLVELTVRGLTSNPQEK